MTALLGIAFPLYSSKSIDKKIDRAVAEIKKDSEKANKKQVAINNALLLAGSKDYWASTEVLEKLQADYPDDVYIDLLCGRNIFYIYYTSSDSPEINDGNISDIEKGIRHYLKVAKSKTMAQSGYLDLGAVFSDSIVHELCMMTGSILEYSGEHGGANYHELAVSVIRAIEGIFGIKSYRELADKDPTDVHIMNYTALNHRLAESYRRFGNINARAQYERTVWLYSMSKELDRSYEIEDCKNAMKTL